MAEDCISKGIKISEKHNVLEYFKHINKALKVGAGFIPALKHMRVVLRAGMNRLSNNSFPLL